MISTASPTVSPRVDQVLERGALDVLHRDPVAPVGLAAVVDADHVRVLEPGRGLRLAAEALDELRVLGEALVQELERDPAVEHRVVGEPDVRHPAAAEAADQRVAVADPLSRLERSSSVEQRLHHLGRDRARDLAAEAARAALEHHRDRDLRVLGRGEADEPGPVDARLDVDLRGSGLAGERDPADGQARRPCPPR